MADSVFNTERYGSLQIHSVGGDSWIEKDNEWIPNEGYLPPQAALIDARGDMIFPYQRYSFQGDVLSEKIFR